MKITINKEPNTKSEALALGIFKENTNQYKDLNPELDKEITGAIKKGAFKNKSLEFFYTKMYNSAYKKIIIVNLGSKNEAEPETLRRAMSIVVKAATKSKLKTITTNIAEMLREETKITAEDLGRALAEGLVLSNYAFEKYLSKKKTSFIKEVSVQWTTKSDKFSKGIKQGTIIANATNFGKDLVNEPSNIVTPKTIEKTARAIANSDKRIKMTVLRRKDLERKGMNGILAVSSAGNFEPRLIVLEYSGGKGEKTALVGKGITFDSGGYNLKPEGGIEDMKIDMGGAAAVLGTIKFLSGLNIKKNVLGIIPTCENLISGKGYKPGDIITMYNKKTVEVLNTDAEGRMILADALHYAEKDLKAKTIIDLATLTGACMVALGYEASGLMGFNNGLNQDLIEAGRNSNDRVWPLPMYDDYQHLMNGEVSDLKNIQAPGMAGRITGAITAGVFLSKFVDKAIWAHLDIAGPAHIPEERFYNQKGATGAGIRMLSYYFLFS